MMFLLQLHRDLPSEERFKEVLDSLHALEIPDKEIERVSVLFFYTEHLSLTSYGQSPEWIEEVLDTIGIEVKWV
jgi:hypothetical protein